MCRKVTKIADRWRITLFRFNLRFLDGNPELEADAAVPQSVHA